MKSPFYFASNVFSVSTLSPKCPPCPKCSLTLGNINKKRNLFWRFRFCDRNRIQTCNLHIRSVTLYSVELCSHRFSECKGNTFFFTTKIYTHFFSFYFIKLVLLLTNLLKASPFSILLASKARSIIWRTISSFWANSL